MTDRHGERWAKAPIEEVADALDKASVDDGQALWSGTYKKADMPRDKPPVKSGNCLILKMGEKVYVRDLPGPCSDQDVKQAARELITETWGCEMTPELLGMMVANAMANAGERMEPKDQSPMTDEERLIANDL